MDKYLDKETKIFLLAFTGMTIFLIFIYPKINENLINLDLTKGISTLVPSKNSTKVAKPTIDTTKNYTATVNTSKGEFEIDLFEKTAPLNVSNINKNFSSYKDAKILDIQKNFLFKIDVASDPKTKIPDEINADYLGLDQKKVKESAFLKEQYVKDDKSTQAFSSENLDKNENLSLKDFYKRELKYTYSSTLTTPKAVKYTVFLANKGPNDNGLDLFIIMSNTAPQVDGRYTPIGQVTKGLDVLDKINEASSSEDIVVNSVSVKKE